MNACTGSLLQTRTYSLTRRAAGRALNATVLPNPPPCRFQQHDRTNPARTHSPDVVWTPSPTCRRRRRASAPRSTTISPSQIRQTSLQRPKRSSRAQSSTNSSKSSPSLTNNGPNPASSTAGLPLPQNPSKLERIFSRVASQHQGAGQAPPLHTQLSCNTIQLLPITPARSRRTFQLLL